MYDELYHYGIKGMRWGVRRYENEDGTLTEAGKKRYNKKEHHKETTKKLGKALGLTTAAAAAIYGGKKAYKKFGTPKDIGIKLYKKFRTPKDLRDIKKQRLKDVRKRFKMSPEELKKKIDILENEKRFKELTYEQVAPGRKAAKEVLANVAKKTATTALSGAALYALKAYLSGKIDKKELANAVYNGGPKKK